MAGGSPTDMLKGALVNGVTAGLTMGMGNLVGGTGIFNEAINYGVKGVTSGVVASATQSILDGDGLGQTLSNIGNGAIQGGVYGVAMGTVSGAANAAAQGKNIWTGKKPNIVTVSDLYDKAVVPDGYKLGSDNIIKEPNSDITIDNFGSARSAIKQWLQSASTLNRTQLVNDIQNAGFEQTSPSTSPIQVFEQNGMKIRLDPPQGKTPFNHMHLEYGGNSYDIFLNPVHFKSPAAHIPIK
ncbi:MAG: hypothetical protein QM610_06155 [Chitinophagaceae bacterium]